jgi:hypothetical protein
MTTTHARPTGPIVCTPWCEDGDGHPNELFAEDQRCFSPSLRVELSEHPLIEMDDGSMRPDCL